MVYLGLPIQNGGSFHGELLNNQMVVQTRTLPNSGDGLLFSIHGGTRMTHVSHMILWSPRKAY